MKKTFGWRLAGAALVIAVSLAVLSFGEGVGADGGDARLPVLRVGNAYADGSGNASVPVYISGNPGICAAIIDFSFDSTELELVSSQPGAGFSGSSVSDKRYVWVGSEDNFGNGLFVTLNFKTLSGFSGNASVKASYADGNICNEAMHDVNYAVIGGQVREGGSICGTHTPEAGYVSECIPTCKRPGCSVLRCSVCGEVISVQESEPLGHSYSSGYCTLCGEADSTAFPHLIASSAECKPGDTVTISFSVPGIAVIKSLMFYDLQYDRSVLTLESGSWSVSGTAISDFDTETETAVLAMSFDTILSGKILSLTFSVNPEASGGSYEVSFRTDARATTSGMESGTPLFCDPGSVFINSEARGDMNSDGAVDSDDAIYLLRNTFDSESYTISQSGDLNGDGFSDSDDAIYLLKFTFDPSDFPLS